MGLKSSLLFGICNRNVLAKHLQAHSYTKDKGTVAAVLNTNSPAYPHIILGNPQRHPHLVQ